jgi:hypothetical protein
MILRGLHWAVFGAGIALLAVAATGVARSWDGKGVGILTAAGLICLLLALVAHRLTGVTVDHGKEGTKIGFALATTVVAEIKATGLAGAAATYSFIHHQLAADPGMSEVKIQLQDEVVRMVQANAFARPVDAAEVDRVLASGSAAERVLVFGLLQSDHSLITIERLRRGITRSRSGNEQYQALLATSSAWSGLTAEERDLLRADVRSAAHIAEDPDRAELAEQILGSQ